VLLDEQDRSRWNQAMIREGRELVEQSLGSGRFGAYTLQAAIAAVHAEAAQPSDTDWSQIVALYDVLLRIHSSPVVQLNRAVAVAMRDGPQAGLTIIDSILQAGELTQYTLAHSARGELLMRLGQFMEARQAFETARSLSNQASEQRFLARKLAKLDS
jgi:RNA polymerase sigma-70 factor (ECF subfamily)